MTQASIKSTDAVRVIGPLAADTDFQVIAGELRMTTDAGGFTAENEGFRLTALAGGRDSFVIGAGKTVRLMTQSAATFVYEALA